MSGVVPFNSIYPTCNYKKKKKNRRHYSLAGFSRRSISVSVPCQRCERVLAQDDFTWSSLHLHPYPLSFTPSLSHSLHPSHCLSFTPSPSLRSLSVRARVPLTLPFHLSHSSVSYSVISCLNYSLISSLITPSMESR